MLFSPSGLSLGLQVTLHTRATRASRGEPKIVYEQLTAGVFASPVIRLLGTHHVATSARTTPTTPRRPSIKKITSKYRRRQQRRPGTYREVVN